MEPKKILIVDDESQLTDLLDQALKEDHYRTVTASRGEEALKKIGEESFDLVLSDMMMPGMNGLELMKKARQIAPELVFILMTAYGHVEGAVRAIQSGAADYIAKPFPLQFLRETVRRALEGRLEGRRTRGTVSEKDGDELVTQDPAMKGILSMVEKAVSAGVPLLIQGETGTGKERVARHFYSRFAKGGRFVAINCAAIPKDLLESELFGHERGAFTGAHEKKRGKFEIANDGVLFLDEIGEMPVELQSKLLRVLQEREFCRVGGNDPVKMSSYLIAASNRDLKDMADKGLFRDDLYFRLSVVVVKIPPLRDRLEDIPLLVSLFLKRYERENGLADLKIDDAALDKLKHYFWPGNIRELDNTLLRAAIMCREGCIREEDLLIEGTALRQDECVEDVVALDEAERRNILQALQHHGGNRTHTAKSLGISLSTLKNKLRKYRAAGLS